MEITIAKATVEDALGIQKVLYETFLKTYPSEEFNITLDDLKYRYKDILTEEVIEERRKMLGGVNDNELILVAKIGEEVVGVCDVLKEEERNYLQAMYVLPEYQGLGIGKNFWKKIQSFLDTHKETTLDVAVYSNEAIKFYKKLGFVDTGKRFSEERFRMRNGAILQEMEMKIPAYK